MWQSLINLTLLKRQGAFTPKQWHLIVCRPECSIADQQRASSPLHHAVNSGATAVDREECMGKRWVGRVKIREWEQGCLCFHFRYLNWGNTRLNSLTCTQEGGHQWVENIWEKAFWLPGQLKRKNDWSFDQLIDLSIHLSLYITTCNLWVWNTKLYRRSYGSHTIKFTFRSRCHIFYCFQLCELAMLHYSNYRTSNFNSCIGVNQSRAGLASLHLTHILRQPTGIQT